MLENKYGQIIKMHNRRCRGAEYDKFETFSTPINGDFDDKRIILNYDNTFLTRQLFFYLQDNVQYNNHITICSTANYTL